MTRTRQALTAVLLAGAAVLAGAGGALAAPTTASTAAALATPQAAMHDGYCPDGQHWSVWEYECVPG
ncbi:hypothetical protein [Actinomadura gamaensis]|uniref:Uncharacterized protein n=1 Tax=Actinomadura gamaensis TaxID=1763541 RepID=A0ABV9UBB1_9ACTN